MRIEKEDERYGIRTKGAGFLCCIAENVAEVGCQGQG